MDPTSTQLSNQSTAGQARREASAQPNAQVSEGGFSNKVKNVMSGSPAVDEVQHHVGRKTGAGAESEMDEAARLQAQK